MFKFLHPWLGLLAASFLLSACPGPGDDDDSAAGDDDDSVAGDDDDSAAGDDDDSTGPDALEIEGNWLDSWGTFHVVADGVWTQGTAPTSSTFEVSIYDNNGKTVVAQNGALNAWAPGKWSRFDWAWEGDTLWYCQTAYDAESQAAARATAGANPQALETDGCGGNPWTSMSSHQGPMDLVGVFHDGYGTQHVVLQETWYQGGVGASASSFAIAEYDNADGWAVAQNGPTNAWSPDLWSRFDWTSSPEGWWYCQTAYDAADQAAALATAAADASEPSTGGCNGYEWTLLGPEAGFLPIQGLYTDEFGTVHTVKWNQWTQDGEIFAVTQWNSSEGWAVAQNDQGNSWAAGSWSRFDWTSHAGGLWYCQTAYEAADEAAAMATPAADPTAPDADGCGGYPWTSLTP